MRDDTNKIPKRIEAALSGYLTKTGNRETWTSLARNIGYTAQAPTNWKKGRISFKVIEKIADYLGADPSWLMYGSPNEDQILNASGIGKSELTNPHVNGFDPNFNIAEVDARLASRVNELYGAIRKSRGILSLNNYEGEDPLKYEDLPWNGNKNKQKTQIVPLLALDDLLNFEVNINNNQSNIATHTTGLSERTFALEIEDNSMCPDFKIGDKIICDPNISPDPGDFVIAKTGQPSMTFKKYRPRGYDTENNIIFELTPLNSDYPVLTSVNQQIEIFATVVEHIRILKKNFK